MLKKYKNIIIVGLIALLGIILILISNFSADTTRKSNIELANELEEKIEAFLLKVDGIKKAEVVLTLKSDITASLNDYYDASQYVNGIAVACTDGDNPIIKSKITKLISAYLGLSSNRIEIVELG